MSAHNLGWMALGMLVMAVVGLPIFWYFADRQMGRLRDSLGRERREIFMAEARRQAASRERWADEPISRPVEGQTIIPPGPWMPITPAEREKYRH